eukprot:3617776-Rhodomonas_salina.3
MIRADGAGRTQTFRARPDRGCLDRNFDQFKKWFDRFGNNPSGLDDAAVEAMRETEKRRKYGLCAPNLLVCLLAASVDGGA